MTHEIKPIFVFDIDGTLMKNSQSELDLEGIKSIQLASKYGKVVLATARPLNGVLNILPLEKIPIDFIIALNGALIYSQNLIIETTPISSNVVKYFLTHTSKFKNLWFFTEDSWYANDLLTEECKKETITIKSKSNNLSKLVDLNSVLKITIVDDIEKNSELRNLCTTRLNNQMYYANSHTNFHEFISLKANKYVALTKISNNALYYAIGDSDNDVEILINAKFGCVVGNGSILAKNVSKYTSDFNFGKGAYDCITRIIELFYYDTLIP